MVSLMTQDDATPDGFTQLRAMQRTLWETG